MHNFRSFFICFLFSGFFSLSTSLPHPCEVFLAVPCQLKPETSQKSSYKKVPGQPASEFTIEQLKRMIGKNSRALTIKSRVLEMTDDALHILKRGDEQELLRGIVPDRIGPVSIFESSELGPGVEAHGYLEGDRLKIIVNSHRNIAADLFREGNEETLAQLIRHEFVEAHLRRVGVSHAHRLVSGMEARKMNYELTLLQQFSILHMTEEELTNIKEEHENDPNLFFYDAARSRLEWLRRLKPTAFSHWL